MSITLKYLQETVIPVLQKENKTASSLKKAIGAFLKQGEEEIPVVNEEGEPVEIEQIILVGAQPAEEEAPAEEEPVTELSIQAAVEKAIAGSDALKAIKTHSAPAVPAKAWAAPKVKKSKVFTGPDGDFKAYGFGKFLEWTTNKSATAKAWLDTNGFQVQKAQSEGVNSEGGSLVPQEFSTDIIRLVEEYGVFRQHARVIPMTRDSLFVPRTVSEGAAAWIGEGGSVTEADNVYDNVELVAKKLGRITRVSRELMEDAAISVADSIATSMAQKFAEAEDAAAFNGTGASTFGGHHGLTEKIKDGNHAASLFEATAGEDTFAEVLIADMHSVIGMLPAYALSGAQWFISQAGFANCFQRLTQAAGGTTRMETEAGARLMFEGYPVVITQSMHNLATALDAEVSILFGNMALSSTLGDRQQLEMSTSEHAYWTTDQIGIRGIQRVSIVNHDLGDGSTAGPMIGYQFNTS
jgi:HK97 family phage major capsid protein